MRKRLSILLGLAIVAGSVPAHAAVLAMLMDSVFPKPRVEPIRYKPRGWRGWGTPDNVIPKNKMSKSCALKFAQFKVFSGTSTVDREGMITGGQTGVAGFDLVAPQSAALRRPAVQELLTLPPGLWENVKQLADQAEQAEIVAATQRLHEVEASHPQPPRLPPPLPVPADFKPAVPEQVNAYLVNQNNGIYARYPDGTYKIPYPSNTGLNTTPERFNTLLKKLVKKNPRLADQLVTPDGSRVANAVAGDTMTAIENMISQEGLHRYSGIADQLPGAHLQGVECDPIVDLKRAATNAASHGEAGVIFTFNAEVTTPPAHENFTGVITKDPVHVSDIVGVYVNPTYVTTVQAWFDSLPEFSHIRVHPLTDMGVGTDISYGVTH